MSGLEFIEISCTKRPTRIVVPTSKSYANRLLILAATDPREIHLKNLPPSSDVTAMIRCLQQVGVIIERYEGNSVIVKNCFPECEVQNNQITELLTGDGGTTNRFLLAFLARGKCRYRLLTDGRMGQRPFGEQVDVLRRLGVEVEIGHLRGQFYFEVQGPYNFFDTSVCVRSSKSTQFASAIMLALHDLLLSRKSSVIPIEVNSSEKYLKLTSHLISNFNNASTFDIVPDFSSVAFFVALGAVLGDLLIINCSQSDPFQADAYILEVLKMMGGVYSFSQEGLWISRRELWAYDFDCALAPDMAPAFCFLAAYAKGNSRLKNVTVLQHKESDRLAEMQKILSLFEIKFTYNEKECFLEVEGQSEKTIRPAITYEAIADHRMIMLAAIFMKKNSGGKIVGHHHVKKSFVDFFVQLENN